MKSSTVHTIARAVLGMLAAGSVPAMSAAGYESGVHTNVGLDAGTVRNSATMLLTLVAVFYPQIVPIFAKLTNSPRLDLLEKRVDKLDGGGTPAKSAVVKTVSAKLVDPDE